LEANIGTNAKQTPAAGNLDITYIDAYSFTYIASNSTTGQRVGITNNAKQVTSYLKSISAPGAANFIPTILYVGGRQAIGTASVLGNGSMLTPPQYPLMTNYFNQLIGYTATNPIKIGLSYADTQIPNSAALTNSFKTYANTDLSGSNWGFKVNGTKYQTMVLYGDFQGQMVSNPAVSYGGLALTNGNLGFYLGSGSISIGFWGGNNTASNPFIAQTFTNVALINQGTADQINNDMRLAAQPTNYLNPGQVGLQLNSNYSNMITSIIGYITASGYTGNIQSIAPEIQGNYIGDLYASVMMGVAGSTNVITDGTNSYTMATNDSGWWWMLKSAPQFDQVQANTNNYDPYSAYFYNNSDGTAYGWAYSDRFTANTNPILLTFASNDIVSILVGSPDLITAPTNSSEAAFWGGSSGGPWNTSSNWSNGIVPSSSTQGVINTGWVSITSAQSAGALWVGLQIQGESNMTGGVSIATNGSLSADYVILGAGTGSSAGTPQALGSITNAGTLSVTNAYLGILGGGGTLVNNGTGTATFETLQVGNGGSGDVSNAGKILATNLTLGVGAGSIGFLTNAGILNVARMTIGGALGSGTLVNSGTINVQTLDVEASGPSGASTNLTLQGGSSLNARNLSIATNPLGSSGSLNINIGAYRGTDTNIQLNVGSGTISLGSIGQVNFNQSDIFTLSSALVPFSTNTIQGNFYQYGAGTTVFSGSNSISNWGVNWSRTNSIGTIVADSTNAFGATATVNLSGGTLMLSNSLSVGTLSWTSFNGQIALPQLTDSSGFLTVSGAATISLLGTNAGPPDSGYYFNLSNTVLSYGITYTLLSSTNLVITNAQPSNGHLNLGILGYTKYSLYTNNNSISIELLGTNPTPTNPATPDDWGSVWSNSSGGSWSVAANWISNAVPSGSDTATINDGWAAVTNSNAVNTLYVGVTNGSNGGLSISGTGTLTASNVYLGIAGGGGGLTNAGSLNVSSNLFVGTGATNVGQIGNGTLVNNGSGSISAYNLSVGFMGGAGYLTNEGTIFATNLSVGFANSQTNVGSPFYGNGTIINGGSGTVTALDFSVGYGGFGVLTNYGVISATNMTIGYGYSSQQAGYLGSGAGTVVLRSDSTLDVGNLYIAWGDSAVGTVKIGAQGGNDTNIILGIGTITLSSSGGTLSFNQADTLTVSSVINGRGWLRQAGTGTTTLTGSNSYTGGTTLNTGTLAISNNAAFGSGTVTFASDSLVMALSNLTVSNAYRIANSVTGTFDVGTSLAFTNSGIIGGAGILAKTGTGTLILSGSNSYSGGTLVSEGTLAGNSTSLQGPVSNNSSVVFNQTASGTYDGIMSGIGSLTKNGAGTLKLTQSNTYIGGTILNAGTLAISNNAAFGSGTVTFAFNSTVSALTNVTVTNNFVIMGGGTGTFEIGSGFSFTTPGVISGLGALTKTGAGKLELSNSNSYSGTTTVSAGTLVASGAHALGASLVALSGGSLSLATNITINSLIWNSAALIALPGVTSGNYLTVTNSITMTGSGTNTFDLTGVTLSTKPVELFNFGTNGLTTNQFALTGVRYYELAVINNALWASNPVLICSTNQTAVVSNTIAFPSVIFDPYSTLNITPSGNLTMTPAMTVSNNSMVILNGVLTTPSLTIDQGSTLMGTGTLSLTGGNLTVNGSFAPGNSPGTFFVSGGNLVMGSSSVWDQQIYSASVYDRVVVTGSAILNGTMNITTDGVTQLQFGQKYNFLTASGGISGAFSSITAPEGFRGRLLLSGNNTQANMLIAPTSYTQLAANRNQSNVATALNSFIPYTSGDHQVVSTSLDSLTASQYNQAFNAIMPTFYQQIATIAFNNANAQNMQLVQRLWGLRVAEGGGFSMSGLADNMPLLEGQGDGSTGKGVLDSNKDILRPGLDNHWGMFVDGNGIFAQANSGNMLPGYNSQSGGITAGLTYKWNESFASGIYCGYQGTYTKSGADGSGLGTGSSLIDNAVRFGVFGTYGQKDGKGLFVNALAGGGYHNFQATRVIQYTGINRTANSAPGAGELDTMLAAGYDIKKDKFTFGPTASLQYSYLGVNSLNETGAQSLSFNSGGWNSSSMLSSVGAHAAYSWVASKNILVVPQVNLSWQHEFMQNPYAISGNLGGTSPTFSNWSATPIRDFLYTGVGFTVEFAKKWNTSFFYNAAAGNSDLVSQNIFWSAGVKF
jgi:autotransporter-associated beta strand protein